MIIAFLERMRFVQLLLLSASCSTVLSIDQHQLEAHFLTDFFRTQNVKISAALCWALHDLKELFLQLSAIYTPASFSKTILFDCSETTCYYLLDLDNCPNAHAILSHNHFQHPVKWLILTHKETDMNYKIYPDSNVIVAKFSDNYCEMRQPYRISDRSPIVWETYGNWSPTHGVLKTQLLELTERRKDLRQAQLKVTTVIRDLDTWNHLEDFRNLETDMFIKQNWGAIKSIMEYSNVNYSLMRTTDFGYVNASGAWSGVIGDLYYGQAHLSGSLPLMNHDRVRAVEYLVMLNPTPIRFVLRKPPLSYVTNIFVLPFIWTVWVAIAVTLVLFALVMLAILNVETQIIGKINRQERFGVKDVFLIAFETLCQQGIMSEPKSVAGRLLSLIFLVVFMFLYVAYSANIVALLQTTSDISTMDQILNSRMEAGAQDVYYMKHYLTETKDKVKQDFYNNKIGPKGFYSVEEGTEKVRKGFFAFHMELGVGYFHILKKYTDYEVCTLQELEGYAQSTGGYVCTPKHSPYREIIKFGALKVEEHGLRKRNYNRVYKKPKCHSKSGSFESVGLTDTYSSLLLCMYGIVFSLVTLFLELWFKKPAH